MSGAIQRKKTHPLLHLVEVVIEMEAFVWPSTTVGQLI